MSWKDYENLGHLIVGCDEVGRGPLAGPVVGAAVGGVVTRESLDLLLDLGVRDSKKLSSKKRKMILNSVGFHLEKNCLQHSKNLSACIIEVSPERIDQINILQASLEAMSHAVIKISQEKNPNQVFVDGNQRLSLPFASTSVVKGDSHYLFIALASILAKEYRDQLMNQYALKYPGFNFEKNSGYPTQEHRQAIQTYGITPIHRRSFKGVKEYIN